MSEATGNAANAAGGINPLMPPVAPALNHLLRRASWARTKLAAHAGKVVRFDIAPFAVALEILPNGEVAHSNATGTTTFRLTPPLLLRLAAQDEHAYREVDTTGDLALAQDVLYIAQNLRWDAEEDLSRVFGDVIAHRIAGAGQAFLQWQRATAGALARDATGYWSEERPLVAARHALEQFGRDVDTLRDDVARFEKRLEQLERR